MILAAERTVNLDSKSNKKILIILSNLYVEQNISPVIIAHNPNTARYCQRISQIQDGQVLCEGKL